MEILEIKQVNDALAEMVALFRVELRSYKGIVSKPNIETGREEMEEYLSAKFPVYAALVDGECAGYTLKFRRSPLEYKDDKLTFDYAETLAEPIQRFADVLENELK